MLSSRFFFRVTRAAALLPECGYGRIAPRLPPLSHVPLFSPLECHGAARLRDPFFTDESDDWIPDWVLNPDADPSALPDDFFRFACYVAVAHRKYGQSFESISTRRIFEWATELGSTLPAELVEHGSGSLPAALVNVSTDELSARANDVTATIDIEVKTETEDAYRKALDYLTTLLTETEFPRTYTIEFSGPTARYLPIPELPEVGVHRLFACAAAYPGLFPAMEAYARAAMREWEWYQDFDEDEDCATPGTFATFALGLADDSYAPLVFDYFRIVDGEHQSLQIRFVEAYCDEHGFTPLALAYLICCDNGGDMLEHRETYPGMIADRDRLETFLQLSPTYQGTVPPEIQKLRAHMYSDGDEGENEAKMLFATARDAIWGWDAQADQGQTVIREAPEELRPLLTEIFAE